MKFSPKCYENLHSTDTHGYTEPVSAITGLIGIEFRPRLAGLYKRNLYAIDAVWTYKELDYKISPNSKNIWSLNGMKFYE